MYDLQILAKWSENQINIQLADCLITAKSIGQRRFLVNLSVRALLWTMNVSRKELPDRFSYYKRVLFKGSE